MYENSVAIPRMMSLPLEALAKHCPEGQDLMTVVAAWGFGVDEKDVTPEQRTVAKTATFHEWCTTSRTPALGYKTWISEEQAAEHRKLFEAKFPTWARHLELIKLSKPMRFDLFR